MAKSNKVSMPMSTAGITRYFDDYKSKFELQPGHVIILIAVVVLIMLLLHSFGSSLIS